MLGSSSFICHRWQRIINGAIWDPKIKSWPLLPLGVMTAGEPFQITIDDNRLTICRWGPSGSIPDFFDRPSEEEQNVPQF